MIARRLIPALALVVLAGCATSKPRGLDDAPLELFEIQEATVPLTAESIYSFDAADRRYNLSAPDFAASSVHRRRPTARFEAQCQHDEDEGRSEFWARDDEGNIVLTASIDYTDNAVTAFQPPLIIAWKELQPGDERESKASMRVVDLQRLSRQVESGTAKRRVRYVSDQRIRTPLGEFVAHRYDVHFSFSLRKAEGFVRSTLFIVPGMGPVAEVRRGEIRILSILPRNMEMLLVLEGVDAPTDDAGAQ
jgi:hypothetical protein